MSHFQPYEDAHCFDEEYIERRMFPRALPSKSCGPNAALDRIYAMSDEEIRASVKASWERHI